MCCASTKYPLYSNDESILRYISDTIPVDYYMERKCPTCDKIVKGKEYDRADIVCEECGTVLMGTVPRVATEWVEYPWGLNL